METSRKGWKERKRGVSSNRSPISHRFHAWCCQAAVLVAIAIPVFTTQLEKSREATDAANIRSAYSEVIAQVLEDGKEDITATVSKKQVQDDWQSASSLEDIAGIAIGSINSTDDTVIVYTASTQIVTIDGTEVATSFIE